MIISLSFLSLFLFQLEESALPLHSGPLVIPINLSENGSDFAENFWIEVRYLARPGGEELFFEPGEKVWLMQDRAFLVLGASGSPLPTEVTTRATVFVELHNEIGDWGPLEIHPLAQAVSISANPEKMVSALGLTLTGIDVSYLAQVAHFLAGNLTSLDVQGTTYNISNYGQVINAQGDFVGRRIDLNQGGASLFVGKLAGVANTSVDNTGIGVQALRFNTTGQDNVGVGQFSLNKNITGSGNTGIGSNALFNNINGFFNSALGGGALKANTDGSYNIAVGISALWNNTHGDLNSACGSFALSTNTLGVGNAALGYFALGGNTTGGNNIAVGYNALPNNTTASQNCALGYLALEKVTIGGNNTGVGAFALNNLIDGINNTAVGVNSGPTAPSTSLDNTTCLGYGARSTANNQIRLGNSAVTSIGGQVGWTTLSDGRFKREITEQVPGLAFILALRPVSYVVDRTALNQFLDPTSQNETPKTADLSTRQTGFIAQEVDALTQKTDAPFSGVDRPLNEATPYGLRYSEFVVPLVKAIQEQQALIEAQKQENQKLQNWVDALSQADQKQQALIENLRKQVEDLQIQISPRLSVVSQ